MGDEAMTMDVMRDGVPVPLRVVPPPTVTGLGKSDAMPVAAGARTKAALLEPLSMRERVMICAIADALQAFRERVDTGHLEPGEKQGLLGLLVAFEDATGCTWVDARWR